MARSSIRRFDVQAKWSLAFSLVSVLSCLALVFLLFRNWTPETHQITFRNPLFKVVCVGFSGVTMILAVFGLALGFNSAGQRRNEKQRLSWTGFFVGAGVLAVACILFLAFYLLRAELPSAG